MIGVSILAGCAGPPVLSARSRRLLQLRTALGVGYMGQGQLGLARHELALALSMDKKDASANNAMAIVEERLHEPVKAVHYFREGIRHHPHNGALQNNYGAFLCGTGHVQQALKHFKTALESPLYATPQLADLNMGICLLRVPNVVAAVHYFHRAQALAPSLPAPFYYLAKVELKQHKLVRARGNIRNYLHLEKTAPALWLGVQIGQATHDASLVHYCATRLLDDFGNTTQARAVENLQKKGRLFGG